MTMLGKSSRCTSRGSSMPFRVTITRLGCSSTGSERTSAATCAAVHNEAASTALHGLSGARAKSFFWVQLTGNCTQQGPKHERPSWNNQPDAGAATNNGHTQTVHQQPAARTVTGAAPQRQPTSSAVFHLASWLRRFWPAHTLVWMILRKSWPERGLKMKMAPLMGLVLRRQVVSQQSMAGQRWIRRLKRALSLMWGPQG